MSVINNVLKDLETRANKFTPIEIGSLGQARKTTASNNTRWLITLLIALLLLGSGWIYRQSSVSQQTDGVSLPLQPMVLVAPQPTELDTPEKTVPAEVAAVIPVVTPNQIIGLQIRETDDSMRLEFALRDKAVTYLKQRGEFSFEYHLRDIESQIPSPQLSDNRWIEQLAIVPTARGVDINFQTAPDILVETHQKLIDGEQIWSIEFTHSTPEAVVVAETQPAVMAQKQQPETAPAQSAQTTSAAAAESSQAEATVEVKLDIKTTDPQAGARNQLAYAIELMQSRRHGEAENLLREMLNTEQDHRARLHLLGLYQHLEMNDRLSRLAQESMLKYPGDTAFASEYARSLFKQGAYQEVIKLLNQTGLRDVNQQSLIAASYQRLDQHDNAVRFYRRALSQDDANARNWIGLAISQEHNSQLADALVSYQTAANLGSLNNRLIAFVEKRSNTLKKVLD